MRLAVQNQSLYNAKDSLPNYQNVGRKANNSTFRAEESKYKVRENDKVQHISIHRQNQNSLATNVNFRF